MRIAGIETEYGIVDPEDPGASPMLLSSLLVEACREAAGEHIAPWDYGGEDPLSDARGIRRDRASAHPDMLTDAPRVDSHGEPVTLRRRRGTWEDPAHFNAVLSNGARFYVDHAHPEYSGPETASARDAVAWDFAGDAIALAATEQYRHTHHRRMHLYKNNVDGKGASYGCHENFLVERSVDFDTLARHLTAHLVTRQVYTGAGRVGLGQFGEQAGFQISQRADYMEAEIGLETTLRRPIINTRDEPHADRSRWRRLHVIIGDANSFQLPAFLKLGTTHLVLAAIEAGDARLEAVVLAEPVLAVQQVSRDLTLRTALELASGERATALDIQRALLGIARDYAVSAEDGEIVERWERVLDVLGRDIFQASADVEWVAKLDLLGRLRAKHADTDGPLPWNHATLAAVDVMWSRLGDGYAAKLTAAGHATQVVTPEQIGQAVNRAPATTRARLRGGMVASRPDLVDAASWSTVVVDQGGADLEVVLLDDPHQANHPMLDAWIAD